MTRLTDDELRTLLTEAFIAHEHLADPDRAVAMAAGPPRPSHRGRSLLGAAAAVVLVAAGTTYAASRGTGPALPDAGPRTPHPTTTPGNPPLPPLQTDAGNRAAAARAAEDAVADLPVFPGAQETGAAGVPGLEGLTITDYEPVDYTVTRQRWWTVEGTTARAVAHWYDAHAPAGFRSGGVGGEGDGRTWVDLVDFYQRNGDVLAPAGVSIEVQTTNAPHGVEVRAVVHSVWPPARPAASYVQDVTSIDVAVVRTHLNRKPHHVRRAFIVTAPGRVLRIATVFDSLAGDPPFPRPCPMIPDVTSYRIVFHTRTGDVTAHYTSTVCGTGMSVRRDGALVPPGLAGADRVISLLRR